MNIKRYLLWVIFFVFLFYSCQKIVEIEILETEPSLVVNSFFCPDSLFKVQVSSSSYIFDTGNFYIDDASVEIYSDDNYIENLQNFGNGFYKSTFKPEESKKYEIKVKYSGYNDVYSKSYTPQKVEITEKNHKFNSYRDSEGIYYHELSIKFNDPAETENYYEIRLYVDSLYDTFWSNWDTTIYKSTFVLMRTNDPSINSELDFSRNSELLVFFTDELINGEEKTIELNYFHNTAQNTPLDTVFNLFIQFNSISKEYYNYVKKYVNYSNSYSLIFIPEYNFQIYNNVENGFGIFAGYNQFIDSLKFR